MRPPKKYRRRVRALIRLASTDTHRLIYFRWFRSRTDFMFNKVPR